MEKRMQCDYCGRYLNMPSPNNCPRNHPEPTSFMRLVFAIEKDMTSRRSLRQAWESIDDEYQWEVRKTWVEIINRFCAEEF